MRAILEQAVIHQLNGDAKKAAELFHEFVVARARQIHESMRNGEDPLVESFDEETVSETYFGEKDLEEVEDDHNEDFSDSDEAGDELADDMGMEGDEDEADLGDADLGDEDDADVGEEGDVDFEDRLEDLQAELERLTAEFEEMQGDDGDDDGALEDDMDDDAAPAEFGDDDFAGEEDEEDEFQGLGESIASELEKVSVSLTQDGKEVGTGAAFAQQKKSPLPQKGNAARQGGAPFTLKSSTHKGFERETAPAVAPMKKRRNTLDKGKESLGAVPAPKAAEGKEVGAGGKTASVNTKSPTSGRK